MKPAVLVAPNRQTSTGRRGAQRRSGNRAHANARVQMKNEFIEPENGSENKKQKETSIINNGYATVGRQTTERISFKKVFGGRAEDAA